MEADSLVRWRTQLCEVEQQFGPAKSAAAVEAEDQRRQGPELRAGLPEDKQQRVVGSAAAVSSKAEQGAQPISGLRAELTGEERLRESASLAAAAEAEQVRRQVSVLRAGSAGKKDSNPDVFSTILASQGVAHEPL